MRGYETADGPRRPPLTWGWPCICGDLATVEVVVRWKNGPRHYWYCEQHAATVLELEGVSRTGDLLYHHSDECPCCLADVKRPAAP